MKSLLILLAFSLFVTTTKAQTFKIVKVETSDPTNYESLSKTLLGRIVTVTMNNSLGIKFVNQRDYNYLYKTSTPNTYELNSDNGKTEEYNTAIVYYKQGNITSIELHLTEKIKQSGVVSTLTYTAKRL